MKLNELFSLRGNSLKTRLLFVLLILILCLFILIIKLINLSLWKIDNDYVHYDTNFYLRRHNITDTNGVILGTDIPTASLYAHPKQIIDINKTINLLKTVLVDLDQKSLLKKFQERKSFVWIKRHITPLEQQKVHNLGLPGIYFINDEKRFYPHSNLISHITGLVDIDGEGISGVEKQYDYLLKQQDLQLSIDIRIQEIVREELISSINTHQAKGASAIVANPNNGEILAMVSIPDFNPNYKNVQPNFNYATLSVQEMGSVLKVFSLAIALDLNKVKINDSFDVSMPIKIGRFNIRDYKGKGGHLSVPEILIYSSNIGIGQIAQKVGVQNQKLYLKKLGFFSKLPFDLPEVGKPLYPVNWSLANLITISYGHGIAITPLHLVQAFCSLINDGTLYKLTLIKDNIDSYSGKTIKANTSKIIRSVLYEVVKDGTAKKANVKGYLVGGKTGTPEKIVNGRYAKHLNTAIFIGAFPIDKPKFVIFIAIDEPKPNAINHGYATGGMIAAPVAHNIIKRMIAVLDILKTDNIDKSFFLNYTPRYKKN